jgi:hypothetical protein
MTHTWKLLLAVLIIPCAAWPQTLSLPTFSAALYGVVGDGVTNDYTHLTNMISFLETAGLKGVIQLPATGHFTLISGPGIVMPPGIGIRGCGMQGNGYFDIPIKPNCGPDVEGTDSYGLFQFLGKDTAYLQDLAVKTTNSCSPIFYITNSLMRVQNVSVVGSASNTSACNDAFVLGGNVSMCINSEINPADCFSGFGSTFDNIYVDQVKRVALFQSDVNQTWWHAVWVADNSGNGSGSESAFEMNCPHLACEGNEIQIGVEMGQSGGIIVNYLYAVGLQSNAISNHIYVDTFDPHTGAIAAVHLDSTSFPNDIHCGLLHLGSPDLSCVDDANVLSGANTVFDPMHNRITVRNLTAIHLGTSSVPVNDIIFGSFTVVNLPSSGNIKVAWVNDSADGSCTSGSGMAGIKVLCFWDSNSMAWEPMGNLSSPTFTSPDIGAAKGTSLLAAGIVDGMVPVTLTTGTTYTLGGTYNSGYTFNQEATVTQAVSYTLPSGTSGGVGKQYCIANSYGSAGGDQGALTLHASIGQYIIYNGARSVSAGNIQSSAALGNSICVVRIDGSNWQVVGQPVGTWNLH